MMRKPREGLMELKGYLWRISEDPNAEAKVVVPVVFDDDDSALKSEISNKSKPVNKICPKSNRVLGTFKSQGAAARHLGVSHSIMKKVMRSSEKERGGFLWSFSHGYKDEVPVPDRHQSAAPQDEGVGDEQDLITEANKIKVRSSNYRGMISRKFGVDNSGVLDAVSRPVPQIDNTIGIEKGNSKDQPAPPLRQKAIERICPESGKVLNVYKSVAEGALDSELLPITLSNAMRLRPGRPVGGYFWRFIDDGIHAGTGEEASGTNSQRESVRNEDAGGKQDSLVDDDGERSIPTVRALCSKRPKSENGDGNTLTCHADDNHNFLVDSDGNEGVDSPPIPSLNVQKIHGRKTIESICPTSGEVLGVYSSISEASRCFGMNVSTFGKHIRRNPGKEYLGRLWRYAGFGTVEPPANAKRVQKSCPKSKKILATFDTQAAAAQNAGLNGTTRQFRKIIASGGGEFKGYLWHPISNERNEEQSVMDINDDSSDSDDDGSSNHAEVGKVESGEKVYRNIGRPVEKLCPITRKVLATYTSQSEVARSLCLAISSFRKRLKKHPNEVYRGFLWRYADQSVVDEKSDSDQRRTLTAVERRQELMGRKIVGNHLKNRLVMKSSPSPTMMTLSEL